MTTPAADRSFLDSNVLLAATDEGRAEHTAALGVLNQWPAVGTALYTSGQILREYLSVATRPAARNGLGLAQPDALANVRALRDRLRFLAEDAKVSQHLLRLLDDVRCQGKQVHDASLVATMLAHGVETIVTLNQEDFDRFRDQVRVLGVNG